MFDIPTNPKIEKCIITKETVINKKAPELIINENKQVKRVKFKKKDTIKEKQGETA